MKNKTNEKFWPRLNFPKNNQKTKKVLLFFKSIPNKQIFYCVYNENFESFFSRFNPFLKKKMASEWQSGGAPLGDLVAIIVRQVSLNLFFFKKLKKKL